MTKTAEQIMMGWNNILSTQELATYWAETAKLDLAFAARAQAWWHNQDGNALRAHKVSAWGACDREAYCLARSYLAMRNAA
jgi:hypothetical protein